jgi:hypothetical protein
MSCNDHWTNFMMRHELLVADNGFSIVPIHSGAKYPGEHDGRRGSWGRMTGWSLHAQFPAPEVILNAWASWPGAGVITSGKTGVTGVDIDILDTELAVKVRDMIEDDLGFTP